MEWPQNPNLQDIQSLPPLDELTEEEKQQLLNVGTRAVTTPLYPVSALAEAVRGFGADLPVEDFVGTQEWAQQQLGGDPSAPENLFADFGTPDPMDASRMARLFTDPAMAMTLFHGSPHKWDRVDLSQIGTGEGVQAYGHGFYAAERPGIAKTYAERLSESKDPILSWKGQSREDMIQYRLESQKKYFDEVQKRGGVGKWSNAQAYHSIWFRNRPIYSYPKELVEQVKQMPVPDVEDFRKFVVESELDGLQWDYDMLSNIKRGDWSMADWLDYRQTVYNERYDDALRRYNAVMDAKKNGSAQVVVPIFRDGKKTGGRAENFREELVDDASIELQKAALNKEAIDGLSPDDFSISQPNKGGYFYELDVPDEQIEKMIDWDAPLSEQPHVKEAVERAIAKEKETGYVPKSYQVMDSTGRSINVTPDNLDNIDGAAAYHVIASTGMIKTGGRARDFQVTHGDVARQAASEILREWGIPGIKYWDGVSRRPARAATRAQGGLINPLVNALRGTEEAPYTRNFVIFDENIVTPLRRNGEEIQRLLEEQAKLLRNE